MLIRFMASVSILAGFGACAGGAWANFFAYSSMLSDSEFSWVFGLFGIVFSLSSVSAISIFVWNLRCKQKISEIVSSLLVGSVASAAGIYGTMIYLQSLDADRIANSELIKSRRGIVISQTETLRGELISLPQGLGTVASIETYLGEVEAVGRTHERPYRLKQIELGHAKRRDELNSKISDLEDRLLNDETLVSTPVRENKRAPLIAIVLEVISTMATAIGFSVFISPKRNTAERAWLDDMVSANL